MNSYVIRVNHRGRVFNFADGFDVGDPGWYVVFTNDVAAVVDLAGPFPDEYDAEMAAVRAEEMAS